MADDSLFSMSSGKLFRTFSTAAVRSASS